MLAEFGHYCPTQPYKTPFEPGKVLGCEEDRYNPSETEQMKYREMGYMMRLVGMLL